MKRTLMMLAAVIALASCTPVYQVRSLSGTQNAVSLSRHDGVYIALPADGAYGSQQYRGSGQTVAETVAAAFSQYAPHVHTAASVSSEAGSLAAAAKYGDRYVVVPAITHWEPRDTAWSGKRSRMALRITVFDVTSGQVLSSVSIEGKSAQQTLSSTSPEKLLDEPVQDYVTGLYR